jgi:hypothetical protein
MRTNRDNKIMTTFGTTLSPINLKEGLFVLKNDAEAIMDTPLEDSIGTKKIFKKGSVVSGTFWKEDSKEGKTRKVVMVNSDLEGRYLLNKKDLKPTTQAEIEIQASKSEVEKLNEKVKSLLEDAKEGTKEIIENPKEVLDKNYYGFTVKQILVAALGVIVLIKVFK